MKKVITRLLAFAAAFSLLSCFSITVNVYFPEKDVKSAFKSLEKDLMKGAPEGEKPAAPADAPKDAEPGPQGSIRIEFGPSSAYAQGASELSSELTDKLKNDPGVVNAYAGMGGRLGYINRLRDQGVVGEGSDGLLKARGQLGKKESAALDEENADRKAVIRAMAKAIVEINKQPVNDSSVSQVLDKAASQFASVRRDSAKPGWWVQASDGSWAQK